MLFNSYAFLIFLPLVWTIYFALNKFKLYRTAQCILIIASFMFYGYQNPQLCLLLAFSIFINYLLHCQLTNDKCPEKSRRLWLYTGIFINLGLLYCFKYVDFTLQNLNRFMKTDFALLHIALPLGISFYTFQQISFTVDSYRRDLPRCGFLEYALFVSFFPQLVAGPIVLHQEMLPQFKDIKNKSVNYENMLSGMEYFIIGFAKKVIIADNFARICDAGYENLYQLNSISAILTVLSFTLQIYFDFSGYCDMAIGLGNFFNIKIPLNFNAPYRSKTIAEFWKRWHMTLTRFLTTYLYIPLGGNRKGKWRTYMNVMLVFLLSGLWHGAAWTYVAWGGLHGVAMVIYRMGKQKIDRIPKGFLHMLTFVFVSVAWTFFRADFFLQPLYLLSHIITGGPGGIHKDMQAAFYNNTLWYPTIERLSISPTVLSAICQLAVTVWVVLWLYVCIKLPASHEIVARRSRSTGWFIILSILFAYSFICLSQVSKFIYFNF